MRKALAVSVLFCLVTRPSSAGEFPMDGNSYYAELRALHAKGVLARLDRTCGYGGDPPLYSCRVSYGSGSVTYVAPREGAPLSWMTFATGPDGVRLASSLAASAVAALNARDARGSRDRALRGVEAMLVGSFGRNGSGTDVFGEAQVLYFMDPESNRALARVLPK